MTQEEEERGQEDRRRERRGIVKGERRRTGGKMGQMNMAEDEEINLEYCGAQDE